MGKGGETGLWIYRVQDRDGRGPYKPGFSHKWSDEAGPILPTLWDDFGPDIARMFAPGWHYGCAFRFLMQAAHWFSPAERERLAALGYRFVEMRVDGVVAESAHQLIIRRKLPLHRRVRALSWDLLSEARAA